MAFKNIVRDQLALINGQMDALQAAKAQAQAALDAIKADIDALKATKAELQAWQDVNDPPPPPPAVEFPPA